MRNIFRIFYLFSRLCFGMRLATDLLPKPYEYLNFYPRRSYKISFHRSMIFQYIHCQFWPFVCATLLTLKCEVLGCCPFCINLGYQWPQPMLIGSSFASVLSTPPEVLSLGHLGMQRMDNGWGEVTAMTMQMR